MTKVTMKVPYADPERVLSQGKTYILPDDLALALCKEGSGETESDSAAKLAKKDAKAIKPPSKPDPGDEEPEDDDDDDDDEEGV